MIEYNNGIHIVGTNLWLDARDPQELCFISHAHVDHLGSHSHIIVSHPTARFYEQRMRATKAHILEFHQPTTIEGMTIELFPAGHILGSSQILIIKDNTRIVYTGDFKLKKNETAEQCEIKNADLLIMEATYGTPQYLFPDSAVIINQLCTALDTTLREDSIPVVLAYSLGKGQEIAKVLGERGYALVLHNTIYDLLKTYEDFGIQFKNYEKFTPLERARSKKDNRNKKVTSFGDTSPAECSPKETSLTGFTQAAKLKGKVLIMPPYVVRSNVMNNLERKKTFLLSGWAIDPTKIPYHVDAAFPLSDHADFNELLTYVRRVQPREIYVTHGDPKFVSYLLQIGYLAHFLGSGFKVDV